ncbi:MAG TPA: flagellar hook protein FlgE [Hyphomicrobiaceae bacterium]|nr:flagellar hook protein FlgE [Hyphomicrobiaceae bacterium]
MGLYGMMRTSASGMAAQANRLATVADNIANTGTTGYKRATTEFSSLLLQSGQGEYISGSVDTNVRYAVSEQGTFKFTTSATDLGVKGNGFFVVSNNAGQTFLTRAGSFVPDGSGNLVNAAGYKLMGYAATPGNTNIVANGTAGLVPVGIGSLTLQANPSAAGTLSVNLPSNDAVVAPANLPSANAATATYSGKTSLIAYDNLGNEVTLDVYSAKTAANTWEVTVYNRAAAGPGGGFPYTAGPIATASLTFDPTNGHLATSSASSLSIPIPNGGTMALDMAQTTQLAADYTIFKASVDGNAPSKVDHVEVSDDGYLYTVFENGARAASYRIPLADVPSPDNLQPLAGNVYVTSNESGDIQVGFPKDGGFGVMVSGALEQSTVDLASELTNMIESERNYTANSKVFQTGADLMDVLVNLKR